MSRESDINNIYGPQSRHRIDGFDLGLGLMKLITCLIILSIIGIVTFYIAFYITGNAHEEHLSHCTVSGKDRGGENSEMRVYTDRCGTLSVKDSFLRHRFDSADVYGRIQVGKTYDIDIVGYRASFLSEFPNIMDAKESK